MADWRCPLCSYGVRQGELQKVSQSKFKVARDAHRASRHEAVTPKEYAVKCRARGLHAPAVVMKRRTGALNRGVGRRFRAGIMAPSSSPTLRPFTWPQLRNASKQYPARLVLYSAWRCTQCVGCFRNLKDAQRHKCQGTLEWRVRSRLRALSTLRRTAHRYEHGLDAKMLEDILTSAHAMLSDITAP